MSAGAAVGAAASSASEPESGAEADGVGDALALGAGMSLADVPGATVEVVLAVEATGEGVALLQARHGQHDSRTTAANPARCGPMAGGFSIKARANRSSAATPRDRTAPS
jgi:hypothetical protein